MKTEPSIDKPVGSSPDSPLLSPRYRAWVEPLAGLVLVVGAFMVVLAVLNPV